MKYLGKLVAFAVIGLALTTPTAAHADPGVASHMKVDGSVTVTMYGITGHCFWSDGVTSDNPPNPLTIYRSTINPPGGNLSCTPSGFTVTLNNDPHLAFSGSTATIDRINASITASGMTCVYEATNVMLYNGTGNFTGYFQYGSLSCPRSVPGSMTLRFH